MAKKKYKPFIIVSPGDIIRDNLEALNWTQDDLANVMGMNPKSINELINNKSPITFESAKLLSKAFGPSPQFWINLDTNYRLRSKDDNVKEKDAELKALIYRYMPIREMINKRWIPDYSSVNELKNNVKLFWNIDTIDFSLIENKELPSFKRSTSFEQYKEYYARTWFRKAKNSSYSIKVPIFKRRELQEIAQRLPEYTLKNERVSHFIEDLYNTGIKFFVLSHLKKTYIDGASFKQNNNPVIVYTGRYDRTDNFWFTLAHEIAHILLHIKTKSDFFIDNLENLQSEKEKEANTFALKTIKANEILEYFKDFGKYISERRVMECSRELRIGKSIIVGVLQHYNILSKRNLNRFKERVIPLIPERYIVG